METFCTLVAALSTLLWVRFALLPWGIWRSREVLELAPTKAGEPLEEITTVIPARNDRGYFADIALRRRAGNGS